jgi:hypothetical protein
MIIDGNKKLGEAEAFQTGLEMQQAEKLKEWKYIFKQVLYHLDNGIVWEISLNSEIHEFLKKNIK